MIFPFSVQGPPVPKERARRCPNGKHVTPKRTRDYESLVGGIAMMLRPRGWKLDGQYRIEVRAYFPDARGRDVDNVAKSILDGLNRVLWKDDRQVIRCVSEKHIDRERPRVEVWVELVEQVNGAAVRTAKEASR